MKGLANPLVFLAELANSIADKPTDDDGGIVEWMCRTAELVADFAEECNDPKLVAKVLRGVVAGTRSVMDAKLGRRPSR